MGARELFAAVTVIELLREPVAAHADILVHAVVGGDLLPEAAVEDAVLEREDEAVLFLECIEERRIESREKDRVDDRRLDAFLFEFGRRSTRQLGEIARADESDAAALGDDLIFVERAVIRAHGIGALFVAHDRHADHDGVRCLFDRPAQHRRVLVEARRCEEDEVRDVGKEGNIKEAEVRHVVHVVHGRADGEKDRGIMIHCDILCHLIVGALEERAVRAEHRTRTAACEPRCHRDGVLLGNADIDVLAAELRTVGGGETDAAHRARCEKDEVWVRLGCLFDKCLCCLLERVGVRAFEFARLNVERHAVVPGLAVLLGELVALALLRMNMHYNRFLAVLDRFERCNQCLGIVAAGDIAVVEPHRAEEVVRRGAARLAQAAELAVHAAVILRDGLVVVVEHNDEVGVHLARDVQPLKRLAARHRAVADKGDYIFFPSRQIACLRKARGQADRGRCVSDVEEVVRTLLRIRVARDRVVVRLVDVCLDTARQHLVRIGLVRDVVDDLVAR